MAGKKKTVQVSLRRFGLEGQIRIAESDLPKMVAFLKSRLTTSEWETLTESALTEQEISDALARKTAALVATFFARGRK